MLPLVAETRFGLIRRCRKLLIFGVLVWPHLLWGADDRPADNARAQATEVSPELARELQKLSQPLDPETFWGILDALRAHGDEVGAALPVVVRVIPRLSLDACDRLSDALASAGAGIAEPMAEYVRDENPRIRFVAIRTLGQLKDWEGRAAYLIAALDDADERVRSAAVDGLGRNPPRKAYDPLWRVLRNESESPGTRLDTAWTVAFIDPDRAAKAARGLVESKDPTLRHAAYLILGYAKDAAPLIDVARRQLERDPRLQWPLVEALARTRHEESRKILNEMLEQRESFEHLRIAPLFIKEAIEALDTGRWPQHPGMIPDPQTFPL